MIHFAKEKKIKSIISKIELKVSEARRLYKSGSIAVMFHVSTWIIDHRPRRLYLCLIIIMGIFILCRTEEIERTQVAMIFPK